MELIDMLCLTSDFRAMPPDTALAQMKARAEEAINITAPYVEYNRNFLNGRTINMRRVGLDGGEAVYVYRDVTREEERTRLLEQARADAEKANRLKSDFIARVSHELRTPMHGVLGMAELIRQSPLSENQIRCLDVLCRSGRHMVDLIDGLLTISTLETGELTAAPEPTDLSRLLGDCVEMVRPHAAAKGLSLDLDRDFSAGRIASVDAPRVSQVVLNLLSNAIKFTEAGRVDVAAHTVRDGADLVLHVDIMDTGCGISADDLETVFEKFTQARGGRDAMLEGVGLGLSISRSLVDLMGGHLHATSIEGQGSTFTLELRAPALAEDAMGSDSQKTATDRIA
jgi:two-component system CheB/CheR fusion protein